MSFSFRDAHRLIACCILMGSYEIQTFKVMINQRYWFLNCTYICIQQIHYGKNIFVVITFCRWYVSMSSNGLEVSLYTFRYDTLNSEMFNQSIEEAGKTMLQCLLFRHLLIFLSRTICFNVSRLNFLQEFIICYMTMVIQTQIRVCQPVAMVTLYPWQLKTTNIFKTCGQGLATTYQKFMSQYQRVIK